MTTVYLTASPTGHVALQSRGRTIWIRAPDARRLQQPLESLARGAMLYHGAGCLRLFRLGGRVVVLDIASRNVILLSAAGALETARHLVRFAELSVAFRPACRHRPSPN